MRRDESGRERGLCAHHVTSLLYDLVAAHYTANRRAGGYRPVAFTLRYAASKRRRLAS
jgi:hypothetical protein